MMGFDIFYFEIASMFYHFFLSLSQIKPLVGPTKAVMSVHITRFQWHEFFPQGKED